MCHFYTTSKKLCRKATQLMTIAVIAMMTLITQGYAQCPPTITLAAPSICEGQTPQLTLGTVPLAAGPYTIVVNGVTYPGIVPGVPFSVTSSDDGFWGTGVPILPPVPDPNAYELGMKFTPTVNGIIKGIRFYKTVGATGPFTGTLWSSTGTPIATGTFTTTPSGWQELQFSSPISVNAGTTYVASYFTPNGNYAQEQGGLLPTQTSIDGFMTTAASGGPAGGNGVYRPGSTGFPTLTYENSNYFVDVIFAPTEDGLWGAAAPPLPIIPDPAAYELGVKFIPSVDGLVRGVRFYKTLAATGTFTGSLWTIGGAQLATGTFTTTASGWQELRFSAPVAVTAGTAYVASYFAPTGNYAQLQDDLIDAKTSLGGYFTTAASGGAFGFNGVYNPGAAGFPALSYENSNYFVDVVFSPSAAVTYELTSITDGGTCAETGAPIASAAMTVNEQPRGSLSGSGSQVAGQPSSILFTGQAGTGPFSLQINGAGYTPVTSGTPFSTGSIPLNQTSSMWTSSTLPTPTASNDGVPLEVGMKFRPAINGTVSALRFYKGVSDVLPTVLKLYTATGTLLASVTQQDAAPAAAGWRSVTLPTAVPLAANTVYLVSYYSASGDYVTTPDFLINDYVSGPLTVPAPGGPAGGNGQYLYGAGGGFPTEFYGILGGSNYWADVVFNSLTYTLPLTLATITDANGCISNVEQFLELAVLNPLPVSLSSFTASVSGQDVKLEWTTASESNNRGFEIQRSDDGSKWVAIGFENGAGNSQVQRTYSFTDRNRPTGKFFYRLKQVDYDGKFKMSNIVSAEINGRISFELAQSFPNPSHGSATITYSVPVKSHVRLVLYDAQGRVVSVLQNGERSAGRYAISVPENLLKSGVYYYKMEAGGFTSTRKMIVQ
jgi:hypothetical protein